MSNYRQMYEDIAALEKADREDPRRPLLRERERLLYRLSVVDKQLKTLNQSQEEESND